MNKLMPDNFSQLFTDRQLVALTTLTDLVMEIRENVKRDSSDAGQRAAVDGRRAAAEQAGLGGEGAGHVRNLARAAGRSSRRV